MEINDFEFTMVYPFHETEQETKIVITPSQMNSNIIENMKDNLVNKLLNKCNETGYVNKIYNIVKYSQGIINAENFSASAIYKVVFKCELCLPMENTFIVGQIKIINQALIIATNGPIKIYIRKGSTGIDNNKFINHDTIIIHKDSNQVIETNSFIKILVKGKKINLGDKHIMVNGIIKDIVTEEEKDKYFYKEINETNNNIDNSVLDILY